MIKVRVFNPLDGSYTERKVKLHMTSRAKFSLIYYGLGILCFTTLGVKFYKSDDVWLAAIFATYAALLAVCSYTLYSAIRRCCQMNAQLEVMREFIESSEG